MRSSSQHCTDWSLKWLIWHQIHTQLYIGLQAVPDESSPWAMIHKNRLPLEINNQSMIYLSNYIRYNSGEVWSHQLLSLVHCNLAFFVCPFTRWLLLYNCPCFRLVLIIHGFRLWTCPHIPTPTRWPHGHSAEHGQHHTAAASEQHVAVFHSRTVSVSHIPTVTPVFILHKARRLED